MNSIQEPFTRVVLIDDHRVVRAGIRMFLDRTRDIRVVGEASNGLEGLEVIKDLCPDVVLLDMEMPVLNGIGVIMKLNEEGIEVRILVLSAYDDSNYVRGVMEKGAAGYLSKDVEPKQVIEAIRRVARGETVEIF
jgi:DNA-binding NarL/FixJ family response regulator